MAPKNTCPRKQENMESKKGLTIEPHSTRVELENYTQLITELAAECGLNIDEVLLEVERENKARHQAIVATEQERDSLLQTLEVIKRELLEAKKERDELQKHINTLRNAEEKETHA